jgi:hypothetical protein
MEKDIAEGPLRRQLTTAVHGAAAGTKKLYESCVRHDVIQSTKVVGQR